MKTKIIVVSVLAALIMAMIPSIHAIEYDTAVETRQEWIHKNIDSLKKIIDDKEMPDGLVTWIFKWLVRILLLPIKLTLKLAMLLARLVWNILMFPIKLMLWLILPW